MGQKKHKYPVRLTREERSELGRLTLKGIIGVRKLNRVKILMLADESHPNGQKTDKEIAEKLDINPSTVERTRQKYVEGGMKSALNEKPRSGRPPEIRGEARAQITALACSTPPEGHGKWTLRLLSNKSVELEFVEQISHETVGQVLKKTLSNRT